jgi:hypothetical protein
MTKRMRSLGYVAALALGALASSNAQAKFVATFQQVGADVVETGKGTLDLTDLGVPLGAARSVAEIAPNDAVIGTVSTGPPGADVNFFRGPTTAPRNFGSGGQTITDLSIGDPVFMSTTQIGAPADYVFGAPLSNQSFYLDTTFSSLGLTPGAYVYSWALAPTRTPSRLRLDQSSPPVLSPRPRPGR